MQGSTIEVTLLEGAGCHLCADARWALEELGPRYRLSIRSVDARSPEGLGLVERHRPALMPLVLVDGRPFSTGRLPRRKLEKYLAGRTAGIAS